MGDGGVAYQKARGALDEGEDVPVAEAAGLPDTPGEDQGKCNFIELNAGPVGSTVDPEILGKAAVGSLRAGEVDECAARCIDAAAGQQGGRGLHHVACPDKVVAAEVVVAFGLSPGDGGGGDKCTGVGLVFMGQQDVVAGLHQQAAVAGFGRQPIRAGGALPLLQEAG